jgi:hypothetical protein
VSAPAVSHLRRSGFFLRIFPGLPAWANLFRAYGTGVSVFGEKRICGTRVVCLRLAMASERSMHRRVECGYQFNKGFGMKGLLDGFFAAE